MKRTLLFFCILFCTHSDYGQNKKFEQFRSLLISQFSDTASADLKVAFYFKSVLADTGSVQLYDIKILTADNMRVGYMYSNGLNIYYRSGHAYNIDTVGKRYTATTSTKNDKPLDFLPHYSVDNFLSKYDYLKGYLITRYTDTVISFTNFEETVIFYFDPLSHKLIRYKQTLVDKKYGTQILDCSFNEIPPTDINIAANLNYSLKKYKHVYSFSASPKKALDRHVDFSKLCRLLSIDTTPRKIFIDFFYQNCVYCIKSFPLLTDNSEALRKKNVLVIGVDPIVADTIGWDAFKSRYKLNYPIIYGNNATQVLEMFFGKNNIGYPLQIMLNADGEVEEMIYGLNERKLSKLFRKNKE